MKIGHVGYRLRKLDTTGSKTSFESFIQCILRNNNFIKILKLFCAKKQKRANFKSFFENNFLFFFYDFLFKKNCCRIWCCRQQKCRSLIFLRVCNCFFLHPAQKKRNLFEGKKRIFFCSSFMDVVGTVFATCRTTGCPFYFVRGFDICIGTCINKNICFKLYDKNVKRLIFGYKFSTTQIFRFISSELH